MKIIKQKGFSLLELIIVIAIVGIMTAITLVSMNTLREKKAVEEAAREVAAAIRETQNYALTGKDITADSSACAYVFGWAGTGYNMSGCDSQVYSLKNDTTFVNNGSFSFSVPFATLNPAADIDIVLLKGGSFYHVCVYISGLVKESLSGC